MICNIRITRLHYDGIYLYVYSFWIDTKLYHMCVYIAGIYIMVTMVTGQCTNNTLCKKHM